VDHLLIEVAREVSVADAQDHREVAGNRLCGPLTAHYGEKRRVVDGVDRVAERGHARANGRCCPTVC
jgi:hypothetical protein